MKINNYIRFIQNEFGHKKVVSKKQLLDFFRRWEPDLKETTLRWRIYELRKQGILQKIGRSEYSFQVKPEFHAFVSNQGKSAFRRISRELPGIKACIWNTESLSDLMLHQPARHMDVLEAEADALRAVYNEIMHMPRTSVTIRNEYNFTFEFHNSDRPSLLVKPLLTRAPLSQQHADGYWLPTLEKILVDIFCEPTDFSAFAGSELTIIIENAYNRYAMDLTKLLQYADRRNKSEEMKRLLLMAGIPQIVFE